MLRKSNQPLQQIAHRLEEHNQFLNNQSTFKANVEAKVFPQLKSEHFEGPLLDNNIIKMPRQFKYISLPKFILSINESDNCCFLTDNTIAIIKNITVNDDNSIKIIGKKFLKLENFYISPCASSDINIFLASNLTKNLQSWNILDVKYKCVK